MCQDKPHSVHKIILTCGLDRTHGFRNSSVAVILMMQYILNKRLFWNCAARAIIHLKIYQLMITSYSNQGTMNPNNEMNSSIDHIYDTCLAPRATAGKT